MQKILVRYGELTLKGKNRSNFERILFNNIQTQLKGLGVSEYKKDRNRIYLYVPEENVDTIVEKLKLVPGIHSFCLAQECPTNLEEIKKLAVSCFDKEQPRFKVNTKRIFKDFPLTSFEISRTVGAAILIANDGLMGMKVDVTNPDQVINIEVHSDKTYIYANFIKGAGGLPIGSSGRALVLLSGGIDSPVAAIMAMKRGLKIDCIHFSSPPYTSNESLNKVKSLVKVLQTYDKSIKLIDVSLTEAQQSIHKLCQDKYQVTLLRRFMLKRAEEQARKLKAKALITGESLGQVASQTIDGMQVSDLATKMLIIRPLVGMDKTQIIELAKEWQTYEISILPYQDCCVVFLPKRPATHPLLKEVEQQEQLIDPQLYLQSEQKVYTYEDLHQDILGDLL